MNDPRKEKDWKQHRHEQKLELLLGAILDALLAKQTLTVPKKRPE